MSLPWWRYFNGDQLKAKRGMTHEQKGIYGDLLEMSWDQAGTLPSDLTELARLVGLSLAQFTPHASIVLQAWRPKGKRLVHEWLQQEYAEKFAKHAERSESGGKGGRTTQDRLKQLKQQQLTQVTKGKLSLNSAQAQLKHPQNQNQNQNHSQKKEREDDAAAVLPDSLSSVELEKGKTLKSKNSTSMSQAQASSADYEKAHTVYPNHDEGKDAGWEVWEKLRKANELPALEIILKSIEVHKHGFSWKRDEGKFIPFFSTWLKGKRWTAEPRPSGSKRLPL